MTDKELKELVASIAIAQKETDKQLKETDKQLKEADERLTRKLDKIGKMVGAIGNNQGDIAEEYFVNSLKDTLKIANISFDALLSNVGLNTKKVNDEFDILLINGDSVAIIEVKYKAHIKDVDTLERKIENIKKLPQYKNYKVYAGIAGFHVCKDVLDSALERGYFVLKRKGDVVESYTDNLMAS